MSQNHQTNGEHQPVLAKETLACLDPKPGESYLDLTAGYGGHASLVLAVTNAPSKLVLVDRDESAIDSLKKRFKTSQIIKSDYLSACQKLAKDKARFDLILADLGVSSPHLDNPDRGFSFKLSGPLDMRMDQSQELSALQLVNDTSEEELAQIIKNYGQDPKAKAIARSIVANRPIVDTSLLAEIIVKSYKSWARTSRIHPATRTFQALRIVVNDELNQLRSSLPLMCQ